MTLKRAIERKCINSAGTSSSSGWKRRMELSCRCHLPVCGAAIGNNDATVPKEDGMSRRKDLSRGTALARKIGGLTRTVREASYRSRQNSYGAAIHAPFGLGDLATQVGCTERHTFHDLPTTANLHRM